MQLLDDPCLDTPYEYEKESEIVDRLYGLLRDRDPQVVVSAILALETILVDEGGIVINNNISAYLLKRYKEWNAPQLQVILSVLCRFQPHTDEEIYDIMVRPCRCSLINNVRNVPTCINLELTM